MARTEILDNLSHQNIKINLAFSEALGDNTASAVTFITEFAEIQKHYPILFRKDPQTEAYQAIALLGIQKDENLFLTDDSASSASHKGWSASYVPAALMRGPFSIVLRKREEQGTEQVEPLVQIDLDHPKADAPEGVGVFLEQGGNSPYLNHIIRVLNLIRDGMSLNKPMFDAFLAHDLLENVDIDIELNNQDKHKITGFSTINTEKLSALGGDALAQLNREGFLQAAFFAVASMSNIQKLIELKNRKLTKKAG